MTNPIYCVELLARTAIIAMHPLVSSMQQVPAADSGTIASLCRLQRAADRLSEFPDHYIFVPAPSSPADFRNHTRRAVRSSVQGARKLLDDPQSTILVLKYQTAPSGVVSQFEISGTGGRSRDVAGWDHAETSPRPDPTRQTDI
jgi:hypothetical protein